MAFNNWENKEQRAVKAVAHTKLMEERYSEEIKNSVKNTVHFNKFKLMTGRATKQNIIVDDLDSVSSVLKHNDGKTAVLNFASYKNPGGMFINGSRAQEECLCHESFLYNVLKEMDPYYEWNRKNLNNALYLDRGLYSPDIIFVRGNQEVKCDVITVAAPNRSAAMKYGRVSEGRARTVLENRIKFVLDIAERMSVDTLILGAYGCGVFGQDPEEVAKIFKYYLETGVYGFKNVYFSIPGRDDGNLTAFNRIFWRQ